MIHIEEDILRGSNEISFEMENRDTITFTKRQKGAWIVIGNSFLLCSVCKRTAPYLTRYCGNCGSIMEGVINSD